MSTRRALRITGTAAYHLLKLINESANAFPALKSVAGDAIYIMDLVVKFRTCKKEWQEFGIYVQDLIATIIDSLGIVDAEQTEVIQKIKRLQSILNEVVEKIKSKQHEGLTMRLFHFMDHPDMIAELRKQVDDAVELFKFDSVVKTEIKVDKTFKIAENNSRLLSTVSLGATLDKLRYVDGASWDLHRVCMENTRKHVIEQALSWVDNAGETCDTNIFLLTGVAGAGKSTVAHTVAQHYARTKQLVTSFFFDRETSERNSPKHLISTMAADLCRSHDRLAERISLAIEEDERVAHAPISRQFEDLIIRPCKNLSIERPMVIILDALDEGCDADLLQILCERVSQLPRLIRFFVTSRTFPELEILRQQPHVRSTALDIYSDDNLGDIALFIPYRLKKVAQYHDLEDDWPDQTVIDAFATKAEGLFLWAATISDYLYTRSDPIGELQKLVSTSPASNTSAESRMDKLYSTILQACNWNDETLVDDYHRLMGAAVATKTPLKLHTLASLYHRASIASNLLRRQLSPLLTGLGREDTTQLVRFIHKSLRDFLTVRASSSSSSPEDHKFGIDEKAHSQTLALMCLGLMNRELSGSILGIGYLKEDELIIPGIPETLETSISEELLYACRFWVDHILDIELPSSLPVLTYLEEFLGTGVTPWMELMAAHGRYEGLSKLRKWVKEQASHHATIMALVFSATQATAARALAERLQQMGRREEALTAAREGVEIYRQLAINALEESRAGLSLSLCSLSKQLARLGYREDALAAAKEAVDMQDKIRREGLEASAADLAKCLHRLSVGYGELGRYEEALATIEEAVKLYRELAAERPASFIPELAVALQCLSTYLSKLGSHQEALAAIENAVTLHRELAKARPVVFIQDLARSLHTLSFDLSNLGRREEALAAIEEAVKLYQGLAAERPAAFIPDLAGSLPNLSAYLSSLGRHEEALLATEKAVLLHKELASERPAAFMPGLARSYHNLSSNLSQLGRHEEALSAIEEVVELYRGLATERPVVFIPDLAHSLHALSSELSSLGHREEALAAIEEAVKLRHEMATKRPAAHTPDLAVSLLNLSIYLSKLGRHNEALAEIEKAVGQYRELVMARPAVFIPGLANSLHSLSSALSNLGRREAALTAIEEVVKLYRGLAAERPAVFVPNLARSLHSLSSYLSNLGRREDALVVTEEAVDLHRVLSVERPAVFVPGLAHALHNFSVNLSDLGRHDEALAAIQEAVTLRQGLATEQPEVFTSDLADSLHSLSIDFSHLGRLEEALPASQEAVKLHRELASKRPAVFIPGLANSLHSLAAFLSDLGRHEQALTAMEETVKLRRELVNERPAAFIPELASSLYSLAIDYKLTGCHHKALDVIKESVELYRPFAEKYPAKYGVEYSHALSLLDVCASNGGVGAEAVAARPEGDAETLAHDDPTTISVAKAGQLLEER